MRWRSFRAAARLAFLVAAGSRGSAGEAVLPPAGRYATLTYPARGNVQLDEGTLELWVVSDFDTDVAVPGADNNDRRFARLFYLYFPDTKWHYVLQFVNWSGSFAMAGYGEPTQRYVWVGPVHWRVGDVRHVVFTWRGAERSVFVDGHCRWGTVEPSVSRDVDVAGLLAGDLTEAILQFSGFVTLDEIQIRDVALTEAEILRTKEAPLVADEHTLLLDRCDGGPAEIIGGLAGETGGAIDGPYQIVEGRFGQAIRLWRGVAQ